MSHHRKHTDVVFNDKSVCCDKFKHVEADVCVGLWADRCEMQPVNKILITCIFDHSLEKVPLYRTITVLKPLCSSSAILNLLRCSVLQYDSSVYYDPGAQSDQTSPASQTMVITITITLIITTIMILTKMIIILTKNS